MASGIYTPLEASLPQAVGGNLSFDVSHSTISSATSSLFVLMISACLLAGMIRFAYAGLLYVKATSSNQANEAKDILKNAAYGIIGVLGIYLILNQINPDMLRGDISFAKIEGNKIVSAQPQATSAVNTSVNPNEAEARKKLIGVGVNNPNPCTGGQTSGCTTIAGLPDKSFDMVNDLKVHCNCSVMITGGTEPGHKSHGPGLNVVDLRCDSGGKGCGTDSLSNYIRSTGASRTPKSFCYEEFYLNGFKFCNEINSAIHWHVYESNF